MLCNYFSPIVLVLFMESFPIQNLKNLKYSNIFMFFHSFQMKWQRLRRLDSITDSLDMSLSKLQGRVKDREACSSWGHKSGTQLSHWTIKVSPILKLYFSFLFFLRFLIVSFLSFLFLKSSSEIFLKLGEIGFQFHTALVRLKGILSSFPITGVGMGMWWIKRHEKKKRENSWKVLFFPRQGYRSLFHFG